MNSRLDPPQHYDDERKAIWADTVTRLTTGGRIFRADTEVLNTYVEAVRSHRQASALLAKSNVMIVRDGRAVENPALAVQRKSAEAISRTSKALGLGWTPRGDTPSLTDPDPAPIHDGKCGAKKKQGDGCCKQAAGWGTPHPGTGRCKLHGGCAPSSRIAGINAAAEKLLYRHDAPPVSNPLEALQHLAGRVLAAEEVIGEKVNELGSWRYEGEGSGEQLRAEIGLLERTMTHLGRLLVDIARLNIDERLVKIEQEKANLIVEAIEIALATAGIRGQQATEAKRAAARHLRAVA